MPLSLAIRNAAARLEGRIAGVAFAGEIIVDSGSTDGTERAAE